MLYFSLREPVGPILINYSKTTVTSNKGCSMLEVNIEAAMTRKHTIL